jgi:hypothetical protein
VMRALVFAWVLILVAVPTPGQDVAASFAAVLPPAVVDVSGWETITGEFETSTARGAYVFHVNPRLQAIYQVMRYRVELLSPATEGQRSRRSTERVAFARKPGAGEPMLCWERAATGASPPWRELAAGSDEYKLEMAVLMQVIGMHRAARVDGVR